MPMSPEERAEKVRQRARARYARSKSDKVYRCGAVRRNRTPCTTPVSSAGARCGKHAIQDATLPAPDPQLPELVTLIKQFGLEKGPTRDPREVLLDAVSRSWQMVVILDHLVRQLESDDLALLGQETDVRLFGPFTVPTAKAKKAMYTAAVLRLQGEWVDRSARISAMTIKTGVEERLVRLAEQQSRLVADVIREVLDNLPISPALRQQALRDVAMRLRALSAPEPKLVGGTAHHAA